MSGDIYQEQNNPSPELQEALNNGAAIVGEVFSAHGIAPSGQVWSELATKAPIAKKIAKRTSNNIYWINTGQGSLQLDD